MGQEEATQVSCCEAYYNKTGLQQASNSVSSDSSLFRRLQSSSLIFDYLGIEEDISLSDSFHI